MSNAIIVKIDLATSPEDFIKRHLGKQSAETRQRIEQVIQEKKLVDNAKNSLQEKTRQRDKTVDDIFTHLHAQGDAGLVKKDVIASMVEAGAAKSSSGVTLKLKTLVANTLEGYELIVSKDKYLIIKMSNQPPADEN